jgi:hypothetical protein
MAREISGAKINPKSSFKNYGAQNTRGRKLREQIRYLENMATYLAHNYVNHVFHCAHFNDSDQCLTILSGNRVYWIPSKLVKKYGAFSEPNKTKLPHLALFFVAQQPKLGLGRLILGVKNHKN